MALWCSSLSNLEDLDLFDTKVSNRALRQIAQLPRMTSLNFCTAASEFDDELLEYLPKLTSLTALWINVDGLTHDKFLCLKPLRRLTKLNLSVRSDDAIINFTFDNRAIQFMLESFPDLQEFDFCEVCDSSLLMLCCFSCPGID